MSDINHKEIVNDKLRRRYQFTVRKDYINKKVEEGLIEKQKSFSLAGFRKGKVPLNIVKMHKERDIINDVVRDQISDISQNFFRESNLTPIDTPNITDVNFDEDLKYEIEIELTPEVPSIDIEKLEIKKESVEITEEDIIGHIAGLTKDCFNLVIAPKIHKIKQGDIVYVDFIGKIDNKIFEGGTGKDFMIDVGSKSVLTEVEDALIGHFIQDDILVDAEFSADYPVKNLATKKVQFSIQVKKVMIKKQITDKNEIMKRFQCETEDDFKEKAKQDLKKKSDSMIEMLAKKEIFNYLYESCVFDVPSTTIQAEAKKISSGSKDKSEIMLEAEKRVRLGFILMKIANEQSINVTEEDISKSLIEKAQGDTKNMQYIIDLYKKNPQASIGLNGEILEKKVTKFIVDSLPNNDQISLMELEEKFKEI